MERWGIGCFDNDVAVNWAFQLIDCKDLSVVTSTLSLAKSKVLLDVDDACKVLAAIETIAKLKGKGGNRTLYSESVDKWVMNNPVKISQGIIDRALEAIEIITDPGSILLTQWEMSEDFIDWLKELESLRNRLMI